MRKYLVLAVVALSLGFTACSDDDDVVKPVVSIINESNENSVAQLDTLYLKAKTENGAAAAKYLWTVNGQEVSTASSYKFSQPKSGEYTIGLTMTDTNGQGSQSEMTAKVYGRFGEGTFVLNEGNGSNETGTLTFIDSRGVLIDSAYYRVNQSLLGNVCQDMFIVNEKIYIISQNGAVNGGEGLLTIANAKTLEKEKIFNDDSKKLSLPTNLAVIADDIYIRDGKGLHVLNVSKNELTDIENSRGAAINRMVVIGNKLFVMASNEIWVIQNKAITTKITASGTLSGIAKAYDGQLWASCTSPDQILKINSSDYTTIGAHDLDSGIGNSWGAAPAFSAKADTLYFSNGTSILQRHIFNENKTEDVADIKESVPDATQYYNSLGVDPISGEVYFATIKDWGQYKINDIAIFDFSKTPALQHDYKNKNSFPAGVYFTSNFK